MKTIKNIAVIGDGGWGTTLGVMLARKGFGVTIWGFFPEHIELIRRQRENVKFLPGIKLPDSIRLTSSMDEALRNSDLVLLATPSQHTRGVLDMLKMNNINEKVFVSVTKGIENNTLKLMNELIVEILGDIPLVMLSGPTIALEVANGIPTTIVAASMDIELARTVQTVFSGDRFRVYANTDVIGVEVGGSIKNVVAIAAGISDALGFGTNTKAALLTRGLVEIVRLGVAMGAKPETLYGLSGLGDLATTCMSSYSRNRWLGEEIGKGKKLKEILGETEMVVEGVATTRSAKELAKKFNVEMPITQEIYKVLYENKDPKIAVQDLMTRSPKEENSY